MPTLETANKIYHALQKLNNEGYLSAYAKGAGLSGGERGEGLSGGAKRRRKKKGVGAKRNPWINFALKYWKQHPNLSYKQALQKASKKWH